MTPQEMDELFERHCAAEAAKDIDAIMDTLADEVEHDVVGLGLVRDRDEIAKRYQEVFDGLDEERTDSNHRYYGDGFFVDDSQYFGTATGLFMGIPGGNRPVSFRILHVCEVRDGKISRENVWFDVPAILAQLAPSA